MPVSSVTDIIIAIVTVTDNLSRNCFKKAKEKANGAKGCTWKYAKIFMAVNLNLFMTICDIKFNLFRFFFKFLKQSPKHPIERYKTGQYGKIIIYTFHRIL